MGRKLKTSMKEIQQDRKSLDKEKTVVESLVEWAAELCRETRRMTSRVELKESMVCSYAEVVREAEMTTGMQYRRALYANTLCKAIAKSALQSLESALILVKTIISVKLSVVDQDEDDAMDSTDYISDTRLGLESAFTELLESVRFLRDDVENVERTAKILEDVGWIDDSVRIANGEFGDLCLDNKQTIQKRSRITSLLRTAMPYEGSRYASKAEYERTVIRKSARRVEKFISLSLIKDTLAQSRLH